MFEINNRFHEQSLGCVLVGKTLQERFTEIEDLEKIFDDSIQNHEQWECDYDKFYSVEVEPGIELADWLYSNPNETDHDMRELLRNMFDQILTELKPDKDAQIDIALGNLENCVGNKKNYRDRRREILAGIKNPEDFGGFMGSCFLESEFSNIVQRELRRIGDFAAHTEEIVRNLALLNDEALEIYERHGSGNEQEAMRELAAKALDCSGDPHHRDQLTFPFPYTENEAGEEITYTAQIVCCPHMKLIRRDSNLRIYFFWKDERIGKGRKVLIGKIGTHPY